MSMKVLYLCYYKNVKDLFSVSAAKSLLLQWLKCISWRYSLVSPRTQCDIYFKCILPYIKKLWGFFQWWAAQNYNAIIYTHITKLREKVKQLFPPSPLNTIIKQIDISSLITVIWVKVKELKCKFFLCLWINLPVCNVFITLLSATL